MNRLAILIAATCVTSKLSAGVVDIREPRLVHYEPNPTGLNTGFWANYRRSADIVRDFGPRPLERVNFHKWSQHEKKPGSYDFKDAFKWERWAHLAGSTVITNINTFFTHKLNPDGMNCIPEFYKQDINDAATRDAARRYLEAAVRKLLEETGGAWIALDYEMLWFALPVKPHIRESYRDWFIESATLCRKVAGEMGMADRIKIGFIANTDPYDTAGHSIGSPAGPDHVPQQWLKDCIAAADFVGLDTYAGGAQDDVTPFYQLRAMRFWLDYYVGDKPFYITESGFSTATEQGHYSKGYHIRGTEAQQAEFFTAMFRELCAARAEVANPLSKVRGYLIWKYADRSDQEDPVEAYLGLTREDGSRKPAHAVVAEALSKIDSDPKLSAWRVSGSRDLSTEVRAGKPFEVSRDGGLDFDVIEFDITPATSAPLMLRMRTSEPVCLLVSVNDAQWLTTHPNTSTEPRIHLPELAKGRKSRIAIQLTSPKYPLKTHVTGLWIENSKCHSQPNS